MFFPPTWPKMQNAEWIHGHTPEHVSQGPSCTNTEQIMVLNYTATDKELALSFCAWGRKKCPSTSFLFCSLSLTHFSKRDRWDRRIQTCQQSEYSPEGQGRTQTYNKTCEKRTKNGKICSQVVLVFTRLLLPQQQLFLFSVKLAGW